MFLRLHTWQDFLGYGFWSKMDNRLEEVVWESLFGGWKWCFVMSFVSIMATFLSFIFTLNSNIFYKDFIYNFSTDTFIFRITSKVFWNTIKRDLLQGREKWNKSCILRRLKKKKLVLDGLTTKFKVRARQRQLNSGKQQTQVSESGWDIYRVEIVAIRWPSAWLNIKRRGIHEFWASSPTEAFHWNTPNTSDTINRAEAGWQIEWD